jgi:cation diffusion facilitator CzcD-associated flavoprotein CzcO
VRLQLPPDFDIDTHFTPRYNPWEERMCAVPGGDLFKAISSGRAEVVTDHIASFTETGIRLRSGAELAADIHRHRNGSRTSVPRGRRSDGR